MGSTAPPLRDTHLHGSDIQPHQLPPGCPHSCHPQGPGSPLQCKAVTRLQYWGGDNGAASRPPALPCSHPLIPCTALAHPSGTSRQQRVCFSGPLKKQKELDGWIGEERGSQCHQPCWCESCGSSVPSPLPQPPPPAHPLGSPGGFWEAPAVAAGAQRAAVVAVQSCGRPQRVCPTLVAFIGKQW